VKRKTLLALTVIVAAASSSLLWPSAPEPMAAEVLACLSPNDAVARAPTSRHAALAERRHVFQSIPSVTLTPIATVEHYSRFHREIELAMPHLQLGDAFKLSNFCRADANRDDRVDGLDVAFFVHAWEQGDTSVGRLADVNRDDRIDRHDYELFLEAYFADDCSPQQQREYRFRIC